jgi:hypothetical protein
MPHTIKVVVPDSLCCSISADIQYIHIAVFSNRLRHQKVAVYQFYYFYGSLEVIDKY